MDGLRQELKSLLLQVFWLLCDHVSLAKTEGLMFIRVVSGNRFKTLSAQL